MSRLFRALGLAAALGLGLFSVSQAEDDWPEVHPCTGAELPLTTERAVVQAAECLFDGRVIKVERDDSGDDWVYKMRILLAEGRVKTVDIHPQSGLPTDPEVREEVYETLDRRR